MTASHAYVALVKECFEPLGVVSVRRMFGGAGIYLDGVMFALIADDVLYLKADEQTCHEFIAEGLEPFRYEGKAKPVSMSYWQAPERLFESVEEMTAWARTALAAARRAAAMKLPRAEKKGLKLRDASSRP